MRGTRAKVLRKAAKIVALGNGLDEWKFLYKRMKRRWNRYGNLRDVV